MQNPQNYYTDVQLDLDEETLNFLRTKAEENNISISGVVETLLEKYILDLEAKAPKRVECTVSWLQDHLYDCIYKVHENVHEYFLYEREEDDKPKCVLVNINKFKDLKP